MCKISLTALIKMLTRPRFAVNSLIQVFYAPGSHGISPLQMAPNFVTTLF
jgi:hypothetical protein